VWKVRPGGPLRGAPTVANGAVYVMSQDNQIYSLKQSDGSQNWSQAASLEIAGVFGSASPAVGQGTVVAGFSSGELNAYRYENGRMVWQDALQRTSIRTSVSSLSDIDADPVIDNGQVFAVGQGGRMVALEINTGQRIWELNIAGIATPWVAGDWIFVVTDEAKLLCISRANGHIRWINRLPQF
jgi:outer membrane protein assembly factor BamB